MAESRLAAPALNPWVLEATGPATPAQVMQEAELRAGRNAVEMEHPLDAVPVRVTPGVILRESAWWTRVQW
jgi:hypothetical protein